MKFCLKCDELINEDKDKHCMIITKLGRKILEFEVFHFECWRGYWRDCVGIEKDKNQRTETFKSIN